MSMVRFEAGISGRLGLAYKYELERTVEDVKCRIASGQVVIGEDKVPRYLSNGRVVPGTIAEALKYIGEDVDIDRTETARAEMNKEFVMSVTMRPIIAEQRAEMVNTFGTGANVMNVVTGESYNL